MDMYKLLFPAEGMYPATEVKFYLLASSQDGDGARRFLVDCVMPPKSNPALWRKYNLCYIKPIDEVDGVLAMARFSAEKPAKRKIVHIGSGKICRLNIHRTKEINGDLCLILSMDDVLFHGIVINLPLSVKNEDHQAFLDGYDHPFFKAAAKSSVKPVKTLFDSVPAEFRDDIETAVGILKNEGASAVCLFGETASPKAKDKNDVCLAVSGIPSQLFDGIYERIEKSVKTKIDLFDMDANRQFFSFMGTTGHMIKLFEAAGRPY
jgi:hypothetical protein